MDRIKSVRSRFPGAGLRRLAVLFATVVIGATISTGCGSTDQAPDLTGMTRNPQLVVKGASLSQHNPERATGEQPLKGPKNGLMLLYFGYTFCPDVCPTTFADLRLALAELDPEQRARVEVAMATVDPKRDTPRVMNRYLGHFFDPDEFATFVPANRQQLAEVERTFGITHRYGKPDESGNYEVEHSAQVFAIDANGRVLVEWPFGSSPKNIASDIRLLLERLDGNETN
ncbi:MAG: SCO family protein [Solirubrobacterales bacterium]|nr:SCO family protein [Solirubrobacterales bacterium]